MTYVGFLFRVVPVAALAIVGTAAGIGWLAAQVPPSFSLPLILVGLLLFIALLTFREANGWNLGLLLLFGIVAGIYLGGIFPPLEGASWGLALLASLCLLLLAAVIGGRLGGRLRVIGIGLWIASWIYLLGWVVVASMNLSTGFQRIWAAVGLIIFSGLATAWFSQHLMLPEGSSSASLAIDLYILGLNLTVASMVILLGIL